MCASAGQIQPHPYYTLRLGGVVQSLKFTQLRGDRYLVAGGARGEAWLVSLATKRPVWKQEIHSGEPVLQIGMLAEGIVMTYGKDQCLCIWRLSEDGLGLVQSIKQEQYSFCNFSILSQTEEVSCLACMAGAEHPNVRVVKLDHGYKDMSEVAILRAEKAKECTSVKIASRDREGEGKQVIVVAAFLTDHIIIWELETASVLFSVERMLSQEILCMDFDTDRMMGLVGGMEGALGVFRVKKNETNEESILNDVLDIKLKNGVGCIRLRGDNKVVACAGMDHGVVVLSWKSLKPLVQLKYHEDSLFDVQYGAEGGENVLAVSSKDKRISLWKLY